MCVLCIPVCASRMSMRCPCVNERIRCVCVVCVCVYVWENVSYEGLEEKLAIVYISIYIFVVFLYVIFVVVVRWCLRSYGMVLHFFLLILTEIQTCRVCKIRNVRANKKLVLSTSRRVFSLWPLSRCVVERWWRFSVSSHVRVCNVNVRVNVVAAAAPPSSSSAIVAVAGVKHWWSWCHYCLIACGMIP